ncbi:MAG: BatD family protein [Pseudomonadota bacterium]
MRGLVTLVATVWWATLAHGSPALVAQLDTTRIQEHETVALTLAYSGEPQLEPDMSPLSADFDIVGRSRSHHTRIVNGEIRVRQILTLQLAPLRTGELVVPSLSFNGSVSEPQTLTVVRNDALDPSDLSHFIEVEVSTTTPWVQQQVLYTVRIFQRTPVIDGSLTEPLADGVALERLGTDRSYRETRDGLSWDVHERRYALFPQRSGEITLDPVRLLARVAADTDNTSFFNRRTRQIRLRSERVQLDVQPAPVDAGWWLPAATLSLTANWREAEAVRVGDPVTLEIVLTAHGVQASLLPELPLPEVMDAKRYPGRSETGQQSLSSGLVGQRRVRHQIVPTASGELAVPPLTVAWWSTTDNATQRTTVTVPSLAVLPAVGHAADKASPALPTPAQPDAGESTAATPNPVPAPSARATVWQRLSAIDWASLLAGAAPVVMLVAGAVGCAFFGRRLWRRYRDSPHAARRVLARAMRHGDRTSAEQALLHWASRVWPVARPRSLQGVADRLGRHGALADRVRALDRALHAASDGAWRDPTLARDLARVPVQHTAPTPEQRSAGALPSLGAAWDSAAHSAD